MEPFPAVVGESRQDAIPIDSTSKPHSDARPRAATTSKATSSHRRTSSGSLLSRFTHSLRVAGEDSELANSPTARRRGKSHPDARPPPGPPSGAVDFVTDTKPGRQRQSSLRKTAILGPGKPKVQRKQSSAAATQPPSPKWPQWLRGDKDGNPDSNTAQPAPPTHSTTSTLKVAVPEERSRTSTELLSPDYVPVSARASPLTSPSTAAYLSTTDEDEGLILPSLSTLANPPGILTSGMTGTAKGGMLPSPSPSSSESSASLAGPISFPHRRLSGRTKSPLAPGAAALADLSALSAEDEWDYAVTAWWGWIILLVTWVVFIVGMGSCFEVWSWAWDVGETPYAPPELEDDPTLPIVGYYPALIVLTGVVSWIWVVVAWVGMKYFKHAKMAGDDT